MLFKILVWSLERKNFFSFLCRIRSLEIFFLTSSEKVGVEFFFFFKFFKYYGGELSFRRLDFMVIGIRERIRKEFLVEEECKFTSFLGSRIDRGFR